MANEKRKYGLEKDEARAFSKFLKTSTKKLNMIAALIRGLDVDKALDQLVFSKKRVAEDVRNVLLSAISNAENNHGLDIDNLYVKEAFVGKSITLKRWRAGSKGRAKKYVRPFSNITIIVKTRKKEEKNGTKG